MPHTILGDPDDTRGEADLRDPGDPFAEVDAIAARRAAVGPPLDDAQIADEPGGPHPLGVEVDQLLAAAKRKRGLERDDPDAAHVARLAGVRGDIQDFSLDVAWATDPRAEERLARSWRRHDAYAGALNCTPRRVSAPGLGRRPLRHARACRPRRRPVALRHSSGLDPPEGDPDDDADDARHLTHRRPGRRDQGGGDSNALRPRPHAARPEGRRHLPTTDRRGGP